MGFSITAPDRAACVPYGFNSSRMLQDARDYRGPDSRSHTPGPRRYRILSACNLEQLAMRERLFEGTRITPRRGPMTHRTSGSCGAANTRASHPAPSAPPRSTTSSAHIKRIIQADARRRPAHVHNIHQRPRLGLPRPRGFPQFGSRPKKSDSVFPRVFNPTWTPAWIRKWARS